MKTGGNPEVVELDDPLKEALLKAPDNQTDSYYPVEPKFTYTPTENPFTELQKMRDDFEKYRCEQTAYQAAEKKSHKLMEKKQFWRGAVAGAIGSTAANLFIFYWPNIASFFSNLFHQFMILLS